MNGCYTHCMSWSGRECSCGRNRSDPFAEFLKPSGGPCAKTTVTCTLVCSDGSRVVGTNACARPQETCPRSPDEGYGKCETICRQMGHAEAQALLAAGLRAAGAHAYVEGHTYACRSCQEALFGAGVVALTIGAPPHA